MRKTETKRSRNNIILVGFMGTGKTVVGNALARRLGFNYIDTDDIIEKRAGKTIPEIFAEDGEAHFRQLEKKAIRSLSHYDKYVIASGGGAVIFDENIKQMKNAGVVICLSARPEVIYERIKHNTYRPLLRVPDPLQRIKELLAQRQAQYEKADVVIDTSELSVDEVVNSIIAELKNRKPFNELELLDSHHSA
ncbi:shikimate kinase [Candidatus Sumerlaeota bacterium]|nr:shikimate kinase [Candidatus Sumerlaeota bacterium]